MIRLLPLLLVVIVIDGARRTLGGTDPVDYLLTVISGAILPVLPNGGWSITVEWHFYLMLPVLLLLSGHRILWILLAAILVRTLIFLYIGEAQSVSYWTIVGRIDQFVLGIAAFRFRHLFRGRHWIALFSLLSFLSIYAWFNSRGGFYPPSGYPSTDPLWILLPAIEGVAYAILITWYDNSFRHRVDGVSRFVGLIGECSYSIYLIHQFFVFRVAREINEHVMNITNLYAAIPWAAVCFLVVLIPSYVSYRYFEMPLLRLRKSYVTFQRV